MRPSGLGGLEELQAEQATGAKAPPAPGGHSEILAKAVEMKGPQMYIVEEINAKFKESLLARVGLRGIVYLRTFPPPPIQKKASVAAAKSKEEIQFPFRIEGMARIKRVMMQGAHISSLGNGLFHVQAQAVVEPIPVLKYSQSKRPATILNRVE